MISHTSPSDFIDLHDVHDPCASPRHRLSDVLYLPHSRCSIARGLRRPSRSRHPSSLIQHCGSALEVDIHPHMLLVAKVYTFRDDHRQWTDKATRRSALPEAHGEDGRPIRAPTSSPGIWPRLFRHCCRSRRSRPRCSSASVLRVSTHPVQAAPVPCAHRGPATTTESLRLRHPNPDPTKCGPRSGRSTTARTVPGSWPRSVRPNSGSLQPEPEDPRRRSPRSQDP